MKKHLAPLFSNAVGFNFFRENKPSILSAFHFENSKSSRSRQRGFTLVEIILAISIVVILTAIGIASYNSSSKANAVFNKAQEIQSLARKLQNDAITAYKPITSGSSLTSCRALGDIDPITGKPYPDAGVVYGTYMIFLVNQINYGYACFDSSNNPLFGTATSPGGVGTLNMPTGWSLVPFGFKTIFFSFNGGAYYNGLTTLPTYSYASAPTTLIVGSRVLAITDGASNNAYIYFGGSGLVCATKVGVSCVN